MVISNLDKQNQNHFRELPYSNQSIIQCHGQFNNLLPNVNLPSKRYLERLPSFHDIDLFSLNLDLNFNSNLKSPLFHPIRCKYYSPQSFNQLKKRKMSAFGSKYVFLNSLQYKEPETKFRGLPNSSVERA